MAHKRKFEQTLAVVQHGLVEHELDSIADQAVEAVKKVFPSPSEMEEKGLGEEMGNVADLVLIGLIIHNYMDKVGRPF